MQIILSSNKIQLLQKQFVNFFTKSLCETTEFDFLYFTSSHKKLGKYILLSSQSNCSYFYLLMINGFMCYVLVEIESILKYKHELTVYYPSSF